MGVCKIAVDLIIILESPLNGDGFTYIEHNVATEGGIESDIYLLIDGEMGVDVAVAEVLFIEGEHKGGVVLSIDGTGSKVMCVGVSVVCFIGVTLDDDILDDLVMEMQRVHHCTEVIIVGNAIQA